MTVGGLVVTGASCVGVGTRTELLNAEARRAGRGAEELRVAIEIVAPTLAVTAWDTDVNGGNRFHGWLRVPRQDLAQRAGKRLS